MGSIPTSRTLKTEAMEKGTKGGKGLLQCIVGNTVRSVVSQANELEIQRGDIVQVFVLGGYVYLIYYR